MGEFLVHSSVVWLNPLPRLGRLRKDPELTLFGWYRPAVSLLLCFLWRSVTSCSNLFPQSSNEP